VQRRSFLPALALIPLLAACGGSGGGMPTPPSPPAAPGGLTLTIVRAANSEVPLQADSAFVRVWNPTTTFSELRLVQIPVPGTTTTVEFTVRAGPGYSVGVVAFDGRSGDVPRRGVAGGRADEVTVASGQTRTWPSPFARGRSRRPPAQMS
jgi:hypothetical protein